MTAGPLPEDRTAEGEDPHARADELEPIPARTFSAWVATLDPGYFALVMATGIVSIAARLLTLTLVAEILLWFTIAAWIVLGAVTLLRAVRFPRRFAASLRAPGSAVAFFTVVAGTNVLATALLAHGMWILSMCLGGIALIVWVTLTYGIFSSIVLAGNRPTLREITGVWLVWVVGTQSVPVLATALAPQLSWSMGQEVLGAAAVMFWGVGVILYLVFVVIIFLRLFLIETTPAEMGPAYWILMGATAISVRAAAGILMVGESHPTHLLVAMRPFTAGFTVVLWSFGSWFIPLLVIFGLWRHFVRHYSWQYEPKLWSIVFPVGMYTVASFTLGEALRVGFLRQLAEIWIWIDLIAWVLVAVLMVTAVVRAYVPATHRP